MFCQTLLSAVSPPIFVVFTIIYLFSSAVELFLAAVGRRQSDDAPNSKGKNRGPAIRPCQWFLLIISGPHQTTPNGGNRRKTNRSTEYLFKDEIQPENRTLVSRLF